MTRVRISTTVDPDLLADARARLPGVPDSSLVERALLALVAAHREAEVDAAYAIHRDHPLDEPDAWGDLASFHDAAARA